MRSAAKQSKEWIVESFFDLLSVKPLHSITISEIADNAELDRRTFYRHFKTKEDVISYYIQEASQHYKKAMQKRGTETDDNCMMTQAFFEVCVKNKDVLMILEKQNLLHLLISDLNSIFAENQHTFFGQEELQLENLDYVLAFNTGGFWNLLIKWLADDGKKTPEQMAEIVGRIFSRDS